MHIAARQNSNSAAIASHASDSVAELVGLLLKHKAGVDLKDNGGCSALLLAARRNNLPIVKLLLASDCDPIGVDRNGYNVLHTAGEKNAWAI